MRSSNWTARNYYPFGEEIGSSANDQYKYASTYRDSTTGLDYAVNRYYASGMARFTTPDPLGHGAAKLTNSISWNLYVYSRNDPVNLLDASGLSAEPPQQINMFDLVMSTTGRWCDSMQRGSFVDIVMSGDREAGWFLQETFSYENGLNNPTRSGYDMHTISGGMITVSEAGYGGQTYDHFVDSPDEGRASWGKTSWRDQAPAPGQLQMPVLVNLGTTTTLSHGTWFLGNQYSGAYTYAVTVTATEALVTVAEMYTQWKEDGRSELHTITTTFENTGGAWSTTRIQMGGYDIDGKPRNVDFRRADAAGRCPK